MGCGTWRCHWGPDLRDRVRCKRIIARIEGVSKPKAKGPVWSDRFDQPFAVRRFGSRRAGASDKHKKHDIIIKKARDRAHPIVRVAVSVELVTAVQLYP